jgi:hypothetical protein
MAIPIFRAAHIGIDHGAIDLAVAAASVGDLFHCGIFKILLRLASISSRFGTGLSPSPVAEFDFRSGLFWITIPAMNARARYWTLHWIRALLFPLPVLTVVRAWSARRTGSRAK